MRGICPRDLLGSTCAVHVGGLVLVGLVGANKLGGAGAPFHDGQVFSTEREGLV